MHIGLAQSVEMNLMGAVKWDVTVILMSAYGFMLIKRVLLTTSLGVFTLTVLF